jgi:flagellar secretion chaperone FliS
MPPAYPALNARAKRPITGEVNPYASTAAYQEQAVLTASPAQLVVLLYDGIVRFLRQADVALGERATVHAHDRMSKAEAIIDELQATLDMSQGRLPENLEGIYVFWKRLLWEVRLERDRDKLARLIGMVDNLRGAWAQIAQSG